MYLSFNPLYGGLQAPEEDIKICNTGNPKRDILLAILHRMDVAIANVVQTLKDEGIYEDTLIM